MKKMAEGKKDKSRKGVLVFGCSNRMYEAKGKNTCFRFFTFSKDVKLRRIWKNRVARKSGKDGFQATVNAFVFEQIAVNGRFYARDVKVV